MEYTTINIPQDNDKLRNLSAGTPLLLNGKVYVMRDAGHKRLMQSIKDNNCPIDIVDSYIYYMGPCPAKPNEIIGSAGPTTSSRMDKYAPQLYEMGMLASIGKGNRNQEVTNAIAKNHGVYLSAIGGAGALYKQCIIQSKIIAYEDLGSEACLEIIVENFPCIVTIDNNGTTFNR